MEKLTGFIEKALLPIASKFSTNRYLKAISNGFAMLLPVLMIGAIFTLLANLQIAPYQAFIQSIHLKEILAFAPTVTTDMLAVYAVVLIAKELAESSDMKAQSTIIATIALTCFLILIPLGVIATKGDVTITVAAALGTKWLGSAGLFTAMIIGLIVPTIYKFTLDKKLVFKMPDSVPPKIAQSFSALIPAFIIAFIFCLIRYGFTLTSYGNANQFIYTLLQKPLTGLGASPITFVIMIFLSSLCWFFGLHGGMIVMPFITMLYTSAGLENLKALADGVAMPNLITISSWGVYGALGGAGGTLGLCIVMVLFGKSKRYKSLAAIAFPSGICGINEPITFGLPMVLNTIMLIPLLLVPVITFGISYFCTILEIVPPLNGVMVPLGTPVIFSGWLTGGFKVAILQIVLILIQAIIYLPFFKVLDKQALLEENNNKEAQEAQIV